MSGELESTFYGNTAWWVRRLIEHHETVARAFNAQVRHIGSEYGEMLGEIQTLYGDNPRRPVKDETAAERALDEMGDIVITTLITMALAYRTKDGVTDSVQAALDKLEERFNFVTNRMEESDEIDAGIKLDEMRY